VTTTIDPERLDSRDGSGARGGPDAMTTSFRTSLPVVTGSHTNRLQPRGRVRSLRVGEHTWQEDQWDD
jgi:hypothetical protein